MNVTATLGRDDEGHVPEVIYILEQVNYCLAPQRYDSGRCGHFRVCTLIELCGGLSGFLREVQYPIQGRENLRSGAIPATVWDK